LEKITAIIPRPRVHLTRFHGVLAPHYKYRKLIVPPKKGDSLPSIENNKNDLVKKTELLGLDSLNGFLTSTLKLAEFADGKSKSLPPSKK